MAQVRLNDRQRAFLMIAWLTDGSSAEASFSFLPETEKPLLSAALGRLASKTKTEKKQVIKDELKRLAVQSQLSFLSEVHPDWLLEALRKENPRMIATILRYLPGHHVSFLLDELPEEILKELPPISETFDLNLELVQILRKRFEQNFVSLPLTQAPVRRLAFDTLPLLPANDLLKLFLDVGFREISLAFTTLKTKTIEVILRRLPLREASLLRLKIEQRGSVPEDRLKKAQAHLLSLDLEKGAPDTMILEAGFFVYSKALLPVHLQGVSMIQQKFSRRVGLLLKNYVDKNLPLNSDKTVVPYQDEVVEIAKKLKEIKK